MPEIANTNTEVAAAVDAGLKMAEAETRIAHVTGSDEIPIPVALLPRDMNAHVLASALELQDARAPAPRRRKGSARHQELASFVAHVNRFKDVDSAIFADVERVTLTAILDYHAPAAPRWGEHRSVYTCPLSRQWSMWTKASGVWMKQDTFGEFIDQNYADLASPSAAGGPLDPSIAEPAQILTMARNLVIIEAGEYRREVNPTTGESNLVQRRENGPASTRIPRAFILGIPVFEGGTLYRVEARVQLTMEGGAPKFRFVLYQPEMILRDAFGAVRAAAAEGTGLPVFAGSPE